MKQLLVHFHLYYIDQLDYFLEKLSNIQGCDYDLYITMVEKNKIAEEKIFHFFPSAHILIVSNKGYDVGPFIYVLNNINIDNYEYILKIHTKNTYINNGDKINGIWISRKCWMQLLVEALIGSPQIFTKNIKKFQQDNTVGMIGSKYLTTSSTNSYTNILSQVYSNIKTLGFDTPSKITFVAGTMFMVRSVLLKPIIKAGYTLDSFEPTGKSSQGNTLAHVFERIFGALVTLQHQKIKKVSKSDYHTKITLLTNRIKYFLFYSKTTKDNSKIYKIFKTNILEIKHKPNKIIYKILCFKLTRKTKQNKIIKYKLSPLQKTYPTY